MRKPRDRYIAVREDGLDEHDIPPPFDQRHAATVGERSSIKNAIRCLVRSAVASDVKEAPTDADAGKNFEARSDDDYWAKGWLADSPASHAPSGSSKLYGGSFGPADALRSRMYLAKFPEGRHALEAYRELIQVIEYCEKHLVMPEEYGDPPFESVARLHSLHNSLASKRGVELLPDPETVNLGELSRRIEATNVILKRLVDRE